MRIGMMIRDNEYRDAMAEMIAGYDKDIFVEIAGQSGVTRDSVILTDIMPHEIDRESLEKIRKRTVFLSSVPPAADEHPGCHVVFKYSSLTEILSELSYVYALWTGSTGSISPSTRVIAVTGESDHISGDRCRALAGQIIYRHGGSVLIMPLGYVNDHRMQSGDDDRGWFRRLMYMIDEGRDYLPDSFTFTDSYGISYLKLPDGINPLTSLSSEHLLKLTASIGKHFDTLILDIGSCYSSTNLKIIEASDNVLFFGSGRRIADISAFLGKDASASVRKIGISDAGKETLSMDDFVSETYGRAKEKKDSPEIQRRNR